MPVVDVISFIRRSIGLRVAIIVFALVPVQGHASLVRLSPSSGVIVLYATLPGGTALDCVNENQCDNGPVSAALKKTLVETSLSVAQVFDRANGEVEAATDGRQQLSLFASGRLDGPLIDSSDFRKAIVIGNGGYTNIPALKGAKGDAAIVSETLRGLKFDVTTGIDKDVDAILADIKRMAEGADGKGTVVVYYAGHGFSTGGGNYLPALSANVGAPDIVRTSLSVADLIAAVSAVNAARKVLILDTHFPAIDRTSPR